MALGTSCRSQELRLSSSPGGALLVHEGPVLTASVVAMIGGRSPGAQAATTAEERQMHGMKTAPPNKELDRTKAVMARRTTAFAFAETGVRSDVGRQTLQRQPIARMSVD